jgi:hypothetical protein
MVKASRASATDGLVAEFSPDGINWDNKDFYTITAGAGKVYSFQPAARYFRVVYTNGATAQTYFRLQTSLKPYYVKPSSHRIGDLISSQDDAELVKAVLTAEMPNGIFTPINATAGGNLKVSLEEFESDVASGPLATEEKQDEMILLLENTVGMEIPAYNYIGVSYPNAVTEVYTYKTGGSGGTTVATITVVYSDSTKEVLTSVTKL